MRYGLPHYVATIGVDFKVKVIERKNKRWKLSIWVSRMLLLASVVNGEDRLIMTRHLRI